jgi:serine/threonine protein kinase
MKLPRPSSRRMNLRLTPTDRLTIARVINLKPSTMSDAIRFAVHTAFVLVQYAQDASARLILRNDVSKTQEDLDLTLTFSKRQDGMSVAGVVSGSEAMSGEILQVRLPLRSHEQLDALLRVGFAHNRTAAVRRSLEMLYHIATKTRSGARFGILSRAGDFTPLPILDLIYGDGDEQGPPQSNEGGGGASDSPPRVEEIQPVSPRSKHICINSIDGQGRYEVLSKFNSNVLGCLYVVRDHRLGRPCAAKVATIPRDCRYEDRVAWFNAELRALVTKGGGHTCGVVDAGVTHWSDQELPFFVIDVSNTKTLEEQIGHTQLSERPFDMIRIAMGVLDILTILHEQRIVHADLKPSTIFLDSSTMTVKLADFGLCISVAKQTDALRLVAHWIRGHSPIANEFTAPEILYGEPLMDARSDIYSLGAILRNMLDASSQPDRGPGTSSPFWREINAIVETALRPDLEKRFQSAEVFRAALKHAETSYLKEYGQSHAGLSGDNAFTSLPLGEQLEHREADRRILRQTEARSVRPMIRRESLALAASEGEESPNETATRVPFACFEIDGVTVEAVADGEGMVFLCGEVPSGAKTLYFGQDGFALKRVANSPEVEVENLGSVDLEQFLDRHRGDPESFPVRFDE